MTIYVRSAPLPDSAVLRRLVTESLETFLCVPKILEKELPWPGRPLLVLDAKIGPVLISIDGAYPEQALINGLSALERFDHEKSILARAYPSMAGRLGSGFPNLIVVSQRQPDGGLVLQKLCEKIHFCLFRPVEVNGELALLIDSPDNVSGRQQLSRDARFDIRTQEATESADGLTEEEELYFQQL
jgi:hypothetical protein